MPDVKIKASGVVFMAPGGRALFLKRAPDSDHPGEWCFPGGGIEDGESPEQAAARECREEVGLEASGLKEIVRLISDEAVEFTTFASNLAEPVTPTLNDEHTEFKWAPMSDPPEPLHPGVEAVLPKLQNLRDGLVQDKLAIALDRASVRKNDQDGHLHVSLTPITKANVCPYRGREIPDWQKLGLDENRIYQLYRHPDELEKAAERFSGKPLLFGHKPISAQDHDFQKTVGAVTGAVWRAPYIMARLDVWPSQAVDAIESGEHEQLSSAYRYRADMTPGKTPDGVRYDGVMRDIDPNHVALVPEGRAGPDVIVLDEKPKPFKPFGDLTMKTEALSRGAAAATTAIALFLKPKLAQDAKVDLAPAVKGLTKKNFKSKKKALVAGVKKATSGKLAQDADLDDLEQFADALEDVLPVEVDVQAEPVEEEPAEDESDSAVVDFLTGKLSDEDLAKVREMLSDDETADPAAMDAKRKRESEKVRKAVSEATKNTVTKPAMDSAIKAAVDAATERTLQTQRDIRDAEREVRGRVGELTIAFDSADHVYRTALEAMKVDVSDIPEGAAKAVFKAIPDAPAPRRTPAVAMDAASAKGFAERYPDAGRIKIAS